MLRSESPRHRCNWVCFTPNNPAQCAGLNTYIVWPCCSRLPAQRQGGCIVPLNAVVLEAFVFVWMSEEGFLHFELNMTVSACLMQTSCMCLQVKRVPALMEALWGWQWERPHPEGCTDVFTRSGKHLHLPCFHQRTSQIWRAHCFGVRHSLRGFHSCGQLIEVES